MTNDNPTSMGQITREAVALLFKDYLMDTRSYCQVCKRDTSDEIPPLHRHITWFYSVSTDMFWFSMPTGTFKTLEAFVAQQAPVSQVILDRPSYAPREITEHEEFSRLFKMCREALGLLAATPIELLEACLARLG